MKISNPDAPADEKFWFIESEGGKLELKVVDDSFATLVLIERIGAKVVQVTVDGEKLMEELGGE